jgi:phosphatidylserine/phosphatidylglycerophosphate/cardiolipin synthase-like enzyme
VIGWHLDVGDHDVGAVDVGLPDQFAGVGRGAHHLEPAVGEDVHDSLAHDGLILAGGECLLDMRVRTRGSHHQKLVVLRHAGRPELDVAYVGGIDLCHGRRDDHMHGGDEQPCPLGAAYGPRPPWHDVQIAIQGPAVADIETVFRERWEDPPR